MQYIFATIMLIALLVIINLQRQLRLIKGNDGHVEYNPDDTNINRAISCGIIAGIIMDSRGSDLSDDKKDAFNMMKMNIMDVTHFTAWGPHGDNVIFRYKDGEHTEAIDIQTKLTINDITTYIPTDWEPFSNFTKTEKRPHNRPYLSAMPEGHPELETFFVNQ